MITLFFWCVVLAIIVALVHIMLLRSRRYTESFEQFQTQSSFAMDRALGLSSDAFDLNQNIESGDTRAGLSFWGKLRVRWLMTRHSLSFDDARYTYIQERFADNEIGPDGMPRDPKAVIFI